MKFGEDFHRRIVPEWSQYYVDYNLVKRLIKTAALSDVHKHLNTAFPALDSFFWRRLDWLSLTETELCENFGLGVEPTSVPDAVEICPSELTFLLGAFVELQRDLEKLRWLECLNAEAVARVFARLERCGADNTRVHSYRNWWQGLHSRWEARLVTDLERMGRLIDSISDGLALPGRTTGRSLFFTRALRQGSYPQTLLEAAQKALESGNADLVIQRLVSANTKFNVMESSYSGFVRSLLWFSVVSLPNQYKTLLTLIPSSERAMVHRDLFKWWVITIGRRQRLVTSTRMKDVHRNYLDPGNCAMPRATAAIVLRSPEALLMKDRSGRLLLHYAASYGLLPICQSIMAALKDASVNPCTVSQAIFSADHGGLVPLQLTVMENHTPTATYLVDIMITEDSIAGGETPSRKIMGDLLHTALRNQNDEIVRHLLCRHADLGRRSSRGETALHVAAQLGRTDYAELIIQVMAGEVAGLDVPDTSRGWTPLFFACANGHLDVVTLLLKAGASQKITDHRGWTAKEHAAFKGHLGIAALFDPSDVVELKGGPANPAVSKTPRANLLCREGEQVIIASLGTSRKDRVVPGIVHSSWSSVHTPGTCENMSFALDISAPDSASAPRRVRLPILDGQINDPFVFSVPESSEPRLLFKIIHLSPDGESAVGVGTALLERNAHQFGTKRQSLIRDQSIPILNKESMEIAGTVTFTFLVAKPYPHLQAPQPVRIAGDAPGQPILVGHRGAGQNTRTHEHLQIGENTVESFLSAAKLGASFVEFDVQVTKDLQPVAFHDFSLSETGTDVPVHDLTLEQFLHSSKIQSPHGNPLSVLGTARSRGGPGRTRSRSVGREFEAGAIQVRDRMRFSADFKSKGFKPNIRGDFVQDSFATLKEILVELPEGIGCDIEIKYPRLHEAVEAGVAPVAIELNTFVDAALDVIHRHGGQRQIILSSFTPEICILISMKQRAYPVFFITNAGRVPMVDMEVRAASVQVAVKFAQRWGLKGIVFACEPLVLCPRLVGFVKARGLVCATYGVLNNEPEVVKAQVEAGVDIIVADRVGLIAKTLASTSAFS